MSSPWSEVRADFPALERWVYLNAAAASPTPRPVRAAVEGYLRELEEGGDLHWEDWLQQREQVRARVAAFIGAEPDEIAFTANSTDAVNLAVDLLAGEGPVLAAEIEFPTVTLPWLHRGVPVLFLPAPGGLVPADAFRAENAPAAGVIAVSHVQFSNGCRQDLDAFGALKSGRRLLVAASQGVGAFPVDVRRSRIDALACAGHKWLCAGYGAGFAYLARSLLEARPPRAMGWLSVEDPFRFDNRGGRLLAGARRSEGGCPPFPGIVALGAAVEYLAGIGPQSIEARVLELNRRLTDGLEQDGWRVLSPAGPHRSGQTLVAVPDPPRAVAYLRERRILVTEKPEGLRVSTHFYNDESDLDALRDALRGYSLPA